MELIRLELAAHAKSIYGVIETGGVRYIRDGDIRGFARWWSVSLPPEGGDARAI